ncbi:unnamed protein product, partial [Ixodes persulcatus]
ISAAAATAVKQAIVFLPTCRRNVKELRAKRFQRAVAQAGIAKPEEVAIKFNAKANTAAAITANPDTAEAMTKVSGETETGRTDGIPAIKTQDGNYCKETTYFKHEPCETNEFFKADL